MADATLAAFGGRGMIKVCVSEPQEVSIYGLSGSLVWRNFVEKEASIPVRRGIYIVGRQKTLVR